MVINIMIKPIVSFITPTYNHENIIKYCIESALNQTYQNWEVNIIDDLSNDRTPKIIEKIK
jgi:teichuronic acid biosynthesis glycosyltransferase TuaG